MKKLIHILTIILSVSTFACQQYKDYPEAIQRAESCMDTHPDSALHYLSAYADSIGIQPEETRMYYHLLTHQAKDKLYMKPESDSLINRIVAFYDETDDKDKRMLAYYYQGSTYRDLNDAPRALKAFQQVLQLGEGYPPCDLFARTYNQMGTLFAYQGLYNESLEANKQSVQQYLLQGKKNRTSYALRDIARMYDAKEQRDSALHYYQEACGTALNAKDSNRYYSILSELGGVYYSLSDFKTAKYLLNTSINTHTKNPANIYAILGAIYQTQGDMDSATYCFKQMLESSELRKQYHAHHHLFQIEMDQNNTQEAMGHYYAANILEDSIKRITATETVAKMNALYNYQCAEQANIQLQLTKEKQTRSIWVLSFFILLLLGIGTTIYQHMQKKHQTALSKEKILHIQTEEKYNNSLKKIEENQLEIDKLNDLLNQNEDKSNHLKQELAIAKKELLEEQNALILASDKERKLSKQVFMESDIFSLFHKVAYTPGLHLSAKEWSSLYHHFQMAYPDFLTQLKELYPNPSEHELRICILLKMGISVTGIASLLESSKPSITNARTRLYEKIFGKKGKACDLDKFIAEL